MTLTIDTTFDFRTDAGGKDPDSFSPTLRRYHQVLWSKPLPSGAMFHLAVASDKTLHHQSDLGEFWLSSDTAVATFTGLRKAAHVIAQISAEENDAFDTAAYTIGGMMVWPAYRVDGKMTINGARGFHPRILDRLDLTLECVRRHYLGEWSPLEAVLARYHDFFELFENFMGYVEFFHLQDMVQNDCSSVRFVMPFDDFLTPAYPGDLETYLELRRMSLGLIHARNRRIDALQLAV